jgi:hypothetical protein
MLNNVAFAALHVTVLLAGVWGALAPRAAAPETAAAGLPEDTRGHPERGRLAA